MLREWIDNLRARMMDSLRPLLKQLATLIDPYVAQGRSRYQKLEPRERILVQIAGGLLAIFLVYNLIYTPIVDLSSGLQDKIVQRQHDLAEVRIGVDVLGLAGVDLDDGRLGAWTEIDEVRALGWRRRRRGQRRAEPDRQCAE